MAKEGKIVSICLTKPSPGMGRWASVARSDEVEKLGQERFFSCLFWVLLTYSLGFAIMKLRRLPTRGNFISLGEG